MDQTTRTNPVDQTSGPVHPLDQARITWTMVAALALIAAVWVCGAVWSFNEQTSLATAKRFDVPQLLPLVLDGFAFAMAAVAWSASIDGRTAGAARVGVLIAILGSAGSNTTWGWQRSHGDWSTVVIAASVPVVANLAFEVLLSEIRRKIKARRGLPSPTPIPAPRLVRLVLAPWPTFTLWRRLVLDATDPRRSFAAVAAANGHHPVPVDQPAAVVAAEPDHHGTDDADHDDVDQQPAPARTTRPRTVRTGKRTTPAARRLRPVRPADQMSIEDRVAELDRRYPDRVPGRNEAMRDTGWTSAGQTSKAVEQLRSRREQTTAADEEHPQERVGA